MTRLKNNKVLVSETEDRWAWVPFPSQELYHSIHGARAEKTDRDWQILRARAENRTLNEISQHFGVSRERVRQIEAKFARQLGRYLEQERSSNPAKL